MKSCWLANRVAAFVIAISTCLILMTDMLRNMPPLQAISRAAFSAFLLGAVTWVATLIGSSVVAEANTACGESNQTAGERSED